MTPEQMCGAQTRRHTACERPKGWGTDHVGFGRCKLHGGSSPSGRKAAALARAASLSEDLASAAVPVKVDPTEALLLTLYSSVALTNAARHHYAQALDHADDENPIDVEAAREHYEDCPDRQQSYAADCVKLGIEAKQIEIIERTGETILALLRDVISELGIPMEQAQPILVRRLQALDVTAGAA